MEALHAWHEFYLLLGTAGATLLALLFVAVSLGTGFLNAKDQSGTRTFMSPVVIHFTSVFFVSAICLVPSHGPLTAGIMILKGLDYAPEVLAGGMLLLAIVNIRNAWDLTLSMVRRHAGERAPR